MLQETQRKAWPRVLQVGRCFVKRHGKLLIVRRAGRDKHNAGKWEAPGGKVEEWQSVADAQKVEVRQETKLEIRIVHDFVCSYRYAIEGGREYKADFAVAEVEGSGAVVLNPKEHSDYRWVSYEQMLEYDLTDETRVAARVARTYLVNRH